MSANRLTGLTWGHKRAIAPLVAASAEYERRGHGTVEWKVRDLAAFEHQPLQDAAASVDLVVFDHPFCGVIAETGCFLPLPEDWIARTLGPAPAARFVGRSYESYAYAGRQWGLPVDGACNHAIYRGDLIDRYGGVPESWDEVLDLGRRLRADDRWLTIGARGHHGLLAVAALMANAGDGMPESDLADFRIDAAGLARSIDRLRALLDLCNPDALRWNSIDLHDAMVARDDLVYCPVVFGFAAYGETTGAARLSFAPLPGPHAPHAAGGVLGGAAVGISSACADPAAALDLLAFLADAEVQTGLFGSHSGQPARIEAWRDPALDARFNRYFSSVLPAMQACSMRPRFRGFQDFERRSGDVLEQGLTRGEATDAIVARILDVVEEVRAGVLPAGAARR